MDDSINVDYSMALHYLLKLNQTIDTEVIQDAIAECYYHQKDYKKAIQYYEKTIQSDYDYRYIARCYQYMNQYDEALNYYKRFVDSEANDKDSEICNIIALSLLANDLETANNYAKLYKNYSFIADFPKNIRAYSALNREVYVEFYTLIAQQDIEQAKQWLSHREGDLANFYKAILAALEDKEREQKSEAYKDLYGKTNNQPLKSLMEDLGKGIISTYLFDKDQQTRLD